MYKIAILYICTGNYNVFWEDFYKSSEEYFLKDYQKEYFVFTDSKNIFCEENDMVNKINQENLGWPYNTLMRFSMFKSIEDKLEKFDYVFFFNANIQFIKPIGNEILPKNEDLVVVQHPGFYKCKKLRLPYERNKESLAYIAKKQGGIYVQGALNGGKSRAFIEMINILAKNVDLDLEKNIVAIWHDESHLNRYIIGKNYKLLHPGYVYPEGWKLPFDKEIITRDKMKWGGHNRLRNNDNINSSIIKNKIKSIYKYIKLWCSNE